METIRYLSKDFKQKAEKLSHGHDPFRVVVPDGRKKNIILKKLPALLGGREVPSNRFASMIQTLRILDFCVGLAGAFSGRNYKITYEDVGDLIITFVPVVAKPNDEAIQHRRSG